jgi:hypothetical protein
MPGTTDTQTGAAVEVRGTVVSRHNIDAERVLWTVRLVLPIGSGLPFWTHPDLTTMYVETGALGFTSVTGHAELIPDPVLPAERAVTGVEAVLWPRSIVTFGAGVQHSIRNPVTQETTIVVTMLIPREATPYDGLWTSEGFRITVA